VAMRAITASLPVARIELARLRLDDIFIALVSDGASEHSALRASFQQLHAEATPA
jgi:hypothetical protein